MNGGFRLGDIGVIGALIVNIIIGTWQIAHLDGRIGSVERDQLRDEVSINSLQTANSAKDIHLSQLDDSFQTMKDNIQSILTIVQHVDTNTGGDTNTPPNFIRRK